MCRDKIRTLLDEDNELKIRVVETQLDYIEETTGLLFGYCDTRSSAEKLLKENKYELIYGEENLALIMTLEGTTVTYEIKNNISEINEIWKFLKDNSNIRMDHILNIRELEGKYKEVIELIYFRRKFGVHGKLYEFGVDGLNGYFVAHKEKNGEITNVKWHDIPADGKIMEQTFGENKKLYLSKMLQERQEIGKIIE